MIIFPGFDGQLLELKGKLPNGEEKNYSNLVMQLWEVEDETVAVLLNKNNDPIEVDLKRFAEMGLDGKSMRNIITDRHMVWEDSIKLDQRGIVFLTTKSE